MPLETDSVSAMTTALTEEEVRARAEAKGYWLGAVPGGYSLTRPPETEPLTLTPLSLLGIVRWLNKH